jgi:hypothetical protein
MVPKSGMAPNTRVVAQFGAAAQAPFAPAPIGYRDIA